MTQAPSPIHPRVALVTPAFAPSVGGAELYHEMIARALAPSADFEVFTSRLNLGDGGLRTTSAPRVPEFPFTVNYLPSVRFLGERLLLPWSLFRNLRRFRPDILWTSQPSLTGQLAGSLAGLLGARWVASYHGDVMQDRVYAPAATWLESRVLRRASRVFTHGPHYATRLVQRGLDVRRVQPVYPGPALGRGTLPSVTGRAPPVRPGPDHPFLFVGGLDRARAYKQPEVAIRAIAALRRQGLPAHLWLVGDGDRMGFLREFSHQLGLERSVEFLGRLSDAELAQRYFDAWALVLPSTSTEGFGIVTVEAMQYGCPSVLPSDLESAYLLAGEGAAVTYAPGSEPDLFRVLAEVWSSRQLRSGLAAACRAQARRHSWVEATRELARSLLPLDSWPQPPE